MIEQYLQNPDIVWAKIDPSNRDSGVEYGLVGIETNGQRLIKDSNGNPVISPLGRHVFGTTLFFGLPGQTTYHIEDPESMSFRPDVADPINQCGVETEQIFNLMLKSYGLERISAAAENFKRRVNNWRFYLPELQITADRPFADIDALKAEVSSQIRSRAKTLKELGISRAWGRVATKAEWYEMDDLIGNEAEPEVVGTPESAQIVEKIEPGKVEDLDSYRRLKVKFADSGRDFSQGFENEDLTIRDFIDFVRVYCMTARSRSDQAEHMIRYISDDYLDSLPLSDREMAQEEIRLLRTKIYDFTDQEFSHPIYGININLKSLMDNPAYQIPQRRYLNFDHSLFELGIQQGTKEQEKYKLLIFNRSDDPSSTSHLRIIAAFESAGIPVTKPGERF